MFFMKPRSRLLIAVVVLGVVFHGDAAEWRWESVGVRYGISATSFNNLFGQAETFTRLDLPWRWNFAEQWRLQSRMDASAGWLGRQGDNAFLGTLGPSLGLRHKLFPIEFEGGSSPTILNRNRFGDTDFGFPLQFTSFLGVSADMGRHWAVGYRFQHMSNAGLGSDNPGLNMHMVSFRYRF
jgi:Lipid A 3-O-deacylase (PagL)